MPRALAAVLRDSGPVTDPGEALLLERFARRRRRPCSRCSSSRMVLHASLERRSRWFRTMRNLGMTAVDWLPPAKRLLAHSALR
jgi:2-polyprenyl-6-methoxyphenol hydroxylase-like FAD-dependent oxidoreductase